MRHEGGNADAEHLGDREHDKRPVAGNANPGNRLFPESSDPVQIDEEIEGLKHHRHEHEAGGLQEMARQRAGRQILHESGIVCHSTGGGATMEGDRRRRSLTHSDGITDHVRGREEEHFRKKDRELIEKLRKADADAKMRRALEPENRNHDPSMLEELRALGFPPDTIPLLPIVPVLQVAWAKAGISTAERTLI